MLIRTAKIALLVLPFLIPLTDAGAQDTLIIKSATSLRTQDSTAKRPDSVKKSVKLPHRATMLAASFPGMGQVYNREYWKIPVVYAGFAGLGYSMVYNTTNFNRYTIAYQDFTDIIPETDSYLEVIRGIDPVDFDPVLHPTTYKPSDAQWIKERLLAKVDYFKKYRDLTYIGVAAWYLISIIDANVDASLSDYDVGRNLNLSLRPASVPAYQGQMFALNLKLVKTF